MKNVTKDNIFVGMIVYDYDSIDDDYTEGYVKECDDIHNVFVEYFPIDNGGSGIYCLDKRCNDYLSLFYDEKDYREAKLKRILK